MAVSFLAKWWKRTPVAWLQMSREKTRLLVAIAGITFADFLMFMQLGFKDALFESTRIPYKGLNADIVLANPQYQTLISVEDFSRERLYQAKGLPEVSSVTTVYLGLTDWINPETRKKRSILVFGVNPTQEPFILPDVAKNLHHIRSLNHVLYDKAGRPEFGPITERFQEKGYVNTELGERLIRVQGLFTMGASFGADGNVIVSDATFHNIFSQRKPDRAELGLIRLHPGADVYAVKKKLENFLPKDVAIYTKDEMAEVEKVYWENGTAIGFVFSLGVVIGFIVGIVIVYQILYSDVSDHLPEYATLKAMGYPDRDLLGVLAQEALMLAILGYIPSLFIAGGFYQLTKTATMLPIFMDVPKAITVLVLTIVMCTGSGVVASRKLLSADPADIF